MHCRNYLRVAQTGFITIVLLFVMGGPFPGDSEGAVTDEQQGDLFYQTEQVMEILTKAKESYNKLKDYTAVIHKEIYEDGEQIKDESTIIKFQKPFKVYLKWLSGKNKGTQLLFVDGEYDNKMIIRKGGGFLKIFGTMEMDPDGFWMKKFTKHSIWEVGFGGIIDRSYNAFRTAIEDNQVSAAQVTTAEIEGRPAYKLVLVMTDDGKDEGYYCRSSIQYYDTQSHLPVKVTFWLWEEDTAEILTFNDIKLNVKLSPEAFDRENEEYHF